MGADAVTASSMAASSEDHVRRNTTPWQTFQLQFQRWTGSGAVGGVQTAAAAQPAQADGSRQMRLASWGQHALMRAVTVAGEFLDGDELERSGGAEGQLSAKTIAALAQKPYDPREYAAQRAAAWEQAITD